MASWIYFGNPLKPCVIWNLISIPVRCFGKGEVGILALENISVFGILGW